MATLFVNGEQVAQGRIEHTEAMFFSADETADVGIDLGTPVVEAIGAEARSKFTGHIPRVTVELREVNAKAEEAVKDGQKLAKQHME
jgi:arylsulfatase